MSFELRREPLRHGWLSAADADSAMMDAAIAALPLIEAADAATLFAIHYAADVDAAAVIRRLLISHDADSD